MLWEKPRKLLRLFINFFLKSVSLDYSFGFDNTKFHDCCFFPQSERNNSYETSWSNYHMRSFMILWCSFSVINSEFWPILNHKWAECVARLNMRMNEFLATGWTCLKNTSSESLFWVNSFNELSVPLDDDLPDEDGGMWWLLPRGEKTRKTWYVCILNMCSNFNSWCTIEVWKGRENHAGTGWFWRMFLNQRVTCYIQGGNRDTNLWGKTG